MTPAENIGNRVQNPARILVEHQCSVVKKRRPNTRYHLTHTDYSNRIGLKQQRDQLLDFLSYDLWPKSRQVICAHLENDNRGSKRGNNIKVSSLVQSSQGLPADAIQVNNGITREVKRLVSSRIKTRPTVITKPLNKRMTKNKDCGRRKSHRE